MNELTLYGDIGADYFGEGITAVDVKNQLDAMPDGELRVRINSPGGSVFEGFTIYNLLKQREGQTTVYVDGLAASAASVIAMAGDVIFMADNALMMIHDPWTMAIGGEQEMLDTANLLQKIKVSIVKTYQSRTNLAEAELSEMMAAETWLSVDEALAHGFATDLVQNNASQVLNLARPWIRNAPKPEQISDTPEAQSAYRIALMRRRLALQEQHV